MEPTATPKRERCGNFSLQECELLVQIMGDPSEEYPKMSRHQLARHRFGNGITAHTKKALWREVATQFSITNEPREADKLEKKWWNLCAKHRSLYSDYVRDRALTGGGIMPKKLEYITESIVNVIGKESVSVQGSSSCVLDTSFNSLKKLSESDHNPEECLSLEDSSSTSTLALENMTMEELKRKKIILEIQYLEKKIKK